MSFLAGCFSYISTGVLFAYGSFGQKYLLLKLKLKQLINETIRIRFSDIVDVYFSFNIYSSLELDWQKGRKVY